MTIEEKAKNYDNVVNKLRDFILKGVDPLITIADVQDFFSQLIMDINNEKIRNMLIKHITQERGSFSNDEAKMVITWLEKQDDKDKEILKLKNKIESLHDVIRAIKETSKIEDKKQKSEVNIIDANIVKFKPGDKVTNGISTYTIDGIEDNYYRTKEGINIPFNLEYRWKIVENEQKPEDKYEPKFHEGDWTVSNLDGKARQISEVHFDESNSYYLVNGMPVNLEEFDRRHHIWSIADARDGDILSNNNSIFIFREEYIAEKPIAYCGLINGCFFIGEDGCWTNKKCYPATKEQCDLLFQKMKEYGYKWNNEKKELLEIEEELTDFEKSLKHIMIETLECGDTRNLKADAEMLLRIAQEHKEWSKEDEAKLKSACALIRNTRLNENEGIVDSTINWLKFIKDRIQHKVELNENDKRMKIHTLEIIKKYWNSLPDTDDENEISESCYNWLNKL